MEQEQIQKVLLFLLERLGNVDLETAKTWAETLENAEDLKAEAQERIDENT